ncbi:carbohydrate kinase family protein [Pasteurellaceae bacterium 22721_9_1]
MTMRNGIIAIGNLLVDRALVISDYPKESMLATISTMERHCGGGCTNVLFNLAKLDPQLPLYLAGAIGKDSEGQFILEQASQQNLNIENVVKFDLPTSFTDVMINSQTGERTFFHYIGAMAEYGVEQIVNIQPYAKIAHIAYLPLLPKLRQITLLKQSLNYLRQHGFLISIDLVSVSDKQLFNQQILPILSDIDYLIINDVEAKWLTNCEDKESNVALLQQMAQDLMARGVRETVVVHHPKWAVAVDKSNKLAIQPSYWLDKSQIISTLGAGDAFCSGVLYGLHQHLDLPDILKLGHGMAYFNLFSLSATGGAVDYTKLQAFIQQSE